MTGQQIASPDRREQLRIARLRTAETLTRNERVNGMDAPGLVLGEAVRWGC